MREARSSLRGTPAASPPAIEPHAQTLRTTLRPVSHAFCLPSLLPPFPLPPSQSSWSGTCVAGCFTSSARRRSTAVPATATPTTRPARLGGESLGKMKKFKSEVIEVIHELTDELESSSAHITSQALEHVSPSSVVLTSGGDELVEAFLREANRKRKFQAVVAGGGASRGGHRLARPGREGRRDHRHQRRRRLRHDVPRQYRRRRRPGVFSNGGVLASAGDLNVAVAAKHHAVPVVVLAGTHELSPLGPGDPEFEMNDLLSPAEVLDYTALADCLPSAAGRGWRWRDGTRAPGGARGRVAGRGAPGARLHPAGARHALPHRRGGAGAGIHPGWGRFPRGRRKEPSERVWRGRGV